MNINVTGNQIQLMEHAIGFEHDAIKRGKYYTYRNRFYAPTDDPMWDGLVSVGYAEKYLWKDGAIEYRVTRFGLNFLEKILDIKNCGG